jgi:MerR family redox-sensitive transcriptional activator SoxR
VRSTMSISEVAAATGVRPSALRYYEEAGLIAPSARVGGRRHYDPGVLGRLGVIALCQDTGFTIAEIRGFLQGHAADGPAWRAFGAAKAAELDQRIAQATEMQRLLAQAMACDCDGPDGCDLIAAAQRRRAGA